MPPEPHMECNRVDELIVDFVYGESGMDGSTRAAFETHVHGCARCTDALAGARRVRVLARQMDLSEPPPTVDARVMAAARVAAAEYATAGVSAARDDVPDDG